MKKFQFKFAAVLRVRKVREEEALRVLAESRSIYHNEILNKEKLFEKLERAYQRREKFGKTSSSISVLLSEQDHIAGVKQRIIQSEQAIFKASRNVEKSLRAYFSARAQCQRVMTLYDKAFLEFKRDLAKSQQKEIDDLILTRFKFGEETR